VTDQRKRPVTSFSGVLGTSGNTDPGVDFEEPCDVPVDDAVTVEDAAALWRASLPASRAGGAVTAAVFEDG